jgi:uncharacterized protein involved in response to NO
MRLRSSAIRNEHFMLFAQIAAGMCGLLLALSIIVVPRPDPKHAAQPAIAVITFFSLTAIIAAWAILRNRAWGHFLNVPWITAMTVIVATTVKPYTFGIPGVWTYSPPIRVEQGIIVIYGVYHALNAVRLGFKFPGPNQESHV